MKKLLFIFVLFISLIGNAQTVTIPDSAFASWIQQKYSTCINGNQLDTICIANLNILSLRINLTSITNLSGLQYFSDLKYLDISYNYNLNSIPLLPKTLKSLFCNNVNLNNLPTLPDSLLYLECISNNITQLPSLPISLKYLFCDDNSLTSLPILPNSLIKLSCGNNSSLTNFPTLPNSISVFSCYNNNLASLPILPILLDTLYCDGNNLTSLPTLPNSLKYISCNKNNLTALPALPNSLVFFKCTDNNLTTLPVLPNSIRFLFCENNNLTNLPSLPNSIVWLACHRNSLTSLPNLPNSLVQLRCTKNNLTTLPPLSQSLRFLLCDSNNIVYLPTLPSLLEHLYCANNNLASLPNLPNGLRYIHAENNTNLNCLPNIPLHLQNLNISGTSITCFPSYTNFMIFPQLPLCQPNSSTNSNNCPYINISGYAFTDNNSNCIYDINEAAPKNIPFNIINNSMPFFQQTILDYYGNFAFIGVPLGNYIVKPDTIPSFIQSCVQSHNVNLNANNFIVSGLYFGLKCKPNVFDLGVKNVLPLGPVFPGQQHKLKVQAGDLSQFYNFNCTVLQNIGATVTINVSGPVQYVAPEAGALTPNNAVGNILTYTIPNISTTNLFNSFNSIFKTDTTAQAGDSVCMMVTVTTPLTGDADLSNNTFKYCYLVVNSYDPNIKVVNKAIVKPTFNDWLTYTIYFQNTGNAQAYNIKLIDTLDNALDLNTFEIIGYSHENSFNLNSSTKQLVVNYPNILLPDSTSNPLGSIGYVQYRIKPSAPMALNNQIKNKAGIYFDFNAPIITNTVTTTATNSVGLTNLNNKNEAMILSPNPASQSLNVSIGKEKIDYIAISELSGKVLLKKKVNVGDSKIDFDLSQIENGLYLMNGYVGEKIVKGKKLVVRK